MTEPTQPVQETKTEENQLRLAIPDVYIVAQSLDVAIKRKTFNEEEIQKVFPHWSRVMRFCEDVKRKTEVEQLYKKETEGTEETKKVEELKEKVEEGN